LPSGSPPSPYLPPSLPGGEQSSRTRAEPGTALTLRAPSFEPQSPYSPPALIHLIAPLGTDLIDVEVTACRQAQRERYVSVRPPRGRRRRRGRCRGRDPAERWRFSGRARLRNRDRCARDPCGRPLGMLAFRVGRRVRITFARAASPRTLGPSQEAFPARRPRMGRCHAVPTVRIPLPPLQ
jgi:hypothetical protein